MFYCSYVVHCMDSMWKLHWIWVWGTPLKSARWACHFDVWTVFVRWVVAKLRFFCFIKFFLVVEKKNLGEEWVFVSLKALSQQQQLTLPRNTTIWTLPFSRSGKVFETKCKVRFFCINIASRLPRHAFIRVFEEVEFCCFHSGDHWDICCKLLYYCFRML